MNSSKRNRYNSGGDRRRASSGHLYLNHSFPKNHDVATPRLVLYLEPEPASAENLWRVLKQEFLREHHGVRQVHRSAADRQYHVLCVDVATAQQAKRQLDGKRFRSHVVRIGYSPVGGSRLCDQYLFIVVVVIYLFFT
jgi:hypothetical protein